MKTITSTKNVSGFRCRDGKLSSDENIKHCVTVTAYVNVVRIVMTAFRKLPTGALAYREDGHDIVKLLSSGDCHSTIQTNPD
jgi:hypothetical protein